MTAYLGDFHEDDTVAFAFTTNAADGGRESFSASLEEADISIYKDGSSTALTLTASTITISANPGSQVGVYLVTVDMSNDTDFTTGADYVAVLYPNDETIDSQNVASVLAHWSCENRTASLSATALANLEDQFDGTGYTAATAPSTQSQVDAIGAASGGALNYEATEDNASAAIIGGITSVGTQTGTFANTDTEDDSYHQIDHAANDIDWVYGFSVGGGRTAVEMTFNGYLTGANDSMHIEAYDHVGAGWDVIATLNGQAGTDNVTISAALLSKHTGTGSELGNVYIRFDANGAMTAPILYVDRLNVAAVNIGQTAGYALGSIWLDTVNGVAGSEAFVNGVADNPTDNIADVLTLSSSVGIERLQCANGTSFTLAAALENWIVDGHEWTIALGGQSVNGSMFIDANVTGIGTGTGSEWENCIFGATTLSSCQLYMCGIGESSGTFTLGAAGAYRLIDCFSDVAGSGSPTIDCTAGAGNITLELRRWSGGITLNGLKSGDVVTIGGSDMGTVTLNGADAEVEIRGICKAVVNNLTGSPSVTFSGVEGADVADILTDTADMQPKLGTPAADISADIAAVKADTAAVLTDTGSTLPATLSTIEGKVDTVDGVADQILVDTSTDGVELSATAVDAILDEVYEGSTTLRQFLRLAASALFGKLSGAATTTVTIRDEADSKNRITATVDADGNRSAVTLDKS